ncbi:MAG: class I SAM-dependent methyltransferase, partial [Thermoplasmata archaeon]|nr:class I SAM-dependent methyltransferase [Thermoplasmata archaeon]
MRKLVKEGYEKGDYLNTYRLDDKIDEYPFEKRILDKLTKRLTKGAKILDRGSGPGIPYDSYLVNKGFDVTGIDISQKHVDMARKNVPEAKYIKGDFSKVDLNESFHAIVSFYAIFHIPRDEHKALFTRMNILLKKDGIILVTLGTSGSEYGLEEDWCGAPMAW